ncbi:transcriptional regulator, TetR family [Pseudoxanthobacter soli DSM 19599]|uniref:Transcriptional regulator, TetR family n=1 Tax=Pseudoxanthobacter soli DSM 19599 TaxID=1123029 RepID=A0A1M7ZKZ4_9HYPH|nr:TetR/AcrR family transcriptional regulator [Pseudoxanthobacter soli]SHO65583.1 transcriptional regulator, TetR family [Pseudoxanthobacter soli DSM 19599]
MSRVTRNAASPDDTRARIIEVAEESFRRVGYAKTTVADIANALEMSPANVYRFFPSKAAINDAILQRTLAEMEEIAWKCARADEPALDRIEAIALGMLRFNHNSLMHERRVHDMVTAAFDENWPSINKFIERFVTLIEGVIRDGIAKGELIAVDPGETAHVLKMTLVRFMHPVVVSQCWKEGDDPEADLRMLMRFLRRSLGNRPPAKTPARPVQQRLL